MARGGGNKNYNQTIFCSTCKKTGHTASNCRYPPPSSNVKCNNCWKLGHNTTDCRKKNNKQNNSKTKNHNGGNNNNNNRNNSKNGNKNQNRNIICNICNRSGHKSSDCKFKRNFIQSVNANTFGVPQTKNGRDKNGNMLQCKHCSGPHYNKRCPNRQDPNSNSGIAAPSQVIYGGQPLTINGFVLRPCYYCGEKHLPENCNLRSVVEPRRNSDTQTEGQNVYGTMLEQYHNVQQQQENAQIQQNRDFGYNQAPAQISNRWRDDNPLCSSPNERIFLNNLLPSDQSYGTHPHPAMHQSYGGKRLRGYTYMGYESDGDVVMEDVDQCECCEFTEDQNIEHQNMIMQQEIRTAIECQRRLNDYRRRGLVDENGRPYFGAWH